VCVVGVSQFFRLIFGTELISSLLIAVCLDGSPPAYHLQRGSGSGADSWLVHIEASHVAFLFIYSSRLSLILMLSVMVVAGWLF
jgi:hypothetical protein